MFPSAWLLGDVCRVLYYYSLNIGIALVCYQNMIISHSYNIPAQLIKANLTKLYSLTLTKCVVCSRPVDSTALSFEQRLVGDTTFCRPCWDEIMIDESMNYLDSPHFMRRQPA